MALGFSGFAASGFRGLGFRVPQTRGAQRASFFRWSGLRGGPVSGPSRCPLLEPLWSVRVGMWGVLLENHFE